MWWHFFFWYFKICLWLLTVWLWYVQVWLSLSLSYIKSFLYLLLIRYLLVIISSNTLPASLFYLLVLRLTLYLQVACLLASQRSLKLKFIFIPQIWEFKLICFQVHYFLKPVQWQDTSCVQYVNSLPGSRLKSHMLRV